jgi:hypothetical protein
MLWLRLCEDCKSIPWFIIDAVRLCACSHGFESKPCCEICEAYGLCYVSNYLGRIPKGRCCTNYKVVVYRIGQTSPVPSPRLPFPLSPLASRSSIPPFPRSPIPRFPVPPFPVPPFPIPGFKDSRFQSISRFSTEKTIFLPVFNLQTLKQVYYSYFTRMYSYVLVFYSYVTRMYSCGVLVTIYPIHPVNKHVINGFLLDRFNCCRRQPPILDDVL